MPSSVLNRKTFVLNSTLIVFVEYSFTHVPIPYNKFHCGRQSQFSKVRREFDTGRVNLDPPMTCADWPVAGNLTLFQNSNHQ